jgi:hypothetical protein
VLQSFSKVYEFMVRVMNEERWGGREYSGVGDSVDMCGKGGIVAR